MARRRNGAKTPRKGSTARPARVRSDPATTRAFSESNPDGFSTDQPEWVSYCPDCGAKLPSKDHEECPYFRGKESDAEGTVTAIECGYPGRPRARKRGRRPPPPKCGSREVT